ncbi:MAG: hypothetical protein ICV63_02700 [Coleofasciculus sp. Co-bin14]|nr:hypothetical protein [Coleofasciculus sp. Co-bin14]
MNMVNQATSMEFHSVILPVKMSHSLVNHVGILYQLRWMWMCQRADR